MVAKTAGDKNVIVLIDDLDRCSLITLVLQYAFPVVTSGIILVIIFSIRTLRRRIKTVSIYMIATARESQEFNDYIQKIRDHLSNKECEMAELWADKLRDKF